MKKLNKNQKILIVVIVIIIIISISYYSYTKENIEYEELSVINQINTENSEETEKEISKIKVHISGAVEKEGVIELESNSRIADLIEKAGGIKQNAYMKEVNLASKLEDGEKVYIPTKEEYEKDKKQETATNMVISNKQELVTGNKQSSNKININTATQEQLDNLPGVGASTAQKIINYRKENGKFKKKEDLKNVSGIGDSKYNQLKDLIEI
mgnify:FL=1